MSIASPISMQSQRRRRLPSSVENQENDATSSMPVALSASSNTTPQVEVNKNPKPAPFASTQLGSRTIVGPHTRVYKPLYSELWDGPKENYHSTPYRYPATLAYSVNNNQRRSYPSEYVLKQSVVGNAVLQNNHQQAMVAAAQKGVQHGRLYPFAPIVISIKRDCHHTLNRSVYQLYLRMYLHDKKTTTNRYDWQIGWVDIASLEYLRGLGPLQKVNHLRGVELLAKKNNFVKLFNHVSKSVPSSFKFVPQSWNLPRQLSEFQAYANNKLVEEKEKGVPPESQATYIVKPGASCQGRGIYLIKDPSHLTSATNHVVSEYIANPLLINKRKFDLRIYVALTSSTPLRMYAFQEGLCRFCTEDYQPPADGNLSQVFGHLTNYSLNKKNLKRDNDDGDGDGDGDGDADGDGDTGAANDNGADESKSNDMNDNNDSTPTNANTATTENKKDNTPDATGRPRRPQYVRPSASHKWSLTQFNEYMAETYGEERLQSVWAEMNAVMVRTVLTASPIMKTAYKTIFPDDATGGHTFQLIGFDIMLDENLTPWLIEVNRNPSLHCDAVIDHDIKTMMLGQLFRILDPPNSCRPTNLPLGQAIGEDSGAVKLALAKVSKRLAENHLTITPDNVKQRLGAKEFTEEYNGWMSIYKNLALQYRLEHEDYVVNLLQATSLHCKAVDALKTKNGEQPAEIPCVDEDVPGYEGKIPPSKLFPVPYTDITYAGDIPVYSHAWHRLYPAAPFADYPYPPNKDSPRAQELSDVSYLIATGTSVQELQCLDTLQEIIAPFYSPSYPFGSYDDKLHFQELYDKLDAILTKESTTLDSGLIHQAFSQRAKPRPNQWLSHPVQSTAARVAARGPGARAMASALSSPTSFNSTANRARSLTRTPDKRVRSVPMTDAIDSNASNDQNASPN